MPRPNHEEQTSSASRTAIEQRSATSPEEQAARGARPILEARNISKNFGAITALAGVSLKLFPGEVLGVVGDNGAGKSTLMKILSGLYRPSGGELLFDGSPVRLDSPRVARNLGIEMVYQDLALAGNLPIHENIYLGREPGRRVLGLTFVDEGRSRRMAADHLANLDIHVKSVDQAVEELSGGQAQAVAIARATALNSRGQNKSSAKSYAKVERNMNYVGSRMRVSDLCGLASSSTSFGFFVRPTRQRSRQIGRGESGDGKTEASQGS